MNIIINWKSTTFIHMIFYVFVTEMDFWFCGRKMSTRIKVEFVFSIYSETISPTKFLYVYKLIGLDEIYKILSLVFKIFLSLGNNVSFVKVLWKIQIYKYLHYLLSNFILLWLKIKNFLCSFLIIPYNFYVNIIIFELFNKT